MRHLGAPAAVIGTLATVITVSPAEAKELQPLVAETGPTLRALPAPVALTAPAARTATAAPAAHTVRAGDTVYAIAQRYRLKTADVLAWNRLSWSSVIYPGQKLRLSPPHTAPAQTQPPKSPTGGASAAVHTVVRGDTVYAISKRYRTTVADVIAWNRLGPSALIHPGQKLKVSAVSTPTDSPSAGSSTGSAPSAPSAKTHRVVAGDTLFAIAAKHSLSVGFLLQANGLREGSIIYPGQSLRLTLPENTQRSATLDATQKANAIRIVRIGRELGVPERGIAIALATAMVESSMRNLAHGDRDSLGLFQQRPSQGWGTEQQIMNADRSIRVFYGGANDPNGTRSRGLLDIHGWQTMAFTDAAQAVQISAYPDRYGQWEQQARRWVATLR